MAFNFGMPLAVGCSVDIFCSPRSYYSSWHPSCCRWNEPGSEKLEIEGKSISCEWLDVDVFALLCGNRASLGGFSGFSFSLVSSYLTYKHCHFAPPPLKGEKEGGENGRASCVEKKVLLLRNFLWTIRCASSNGSSIQLGDL